MQVVVDAWYCSKMLRCTLSLIVLTFLWWSFLQWLIDIVQCTCIMYAYFNIVLRLYGIWDDIILLIDSNCCIYTSIHKKRSINIIIRICIVPICVCYKQRNNKGMFFYISQVGWWATLFRLNNHRHNITILQYIVHFHCRRRRLKPGGGTHSRLSPSSRTHRLQHHRPDVTSGSTRHTVHRQFINTVCSRRMPVDVRRWFYL